MQKNKNLICLLMIKPHVVLDLHLHAVDGEKKNAKSYTTLAVPKSI